MAKRKTASEDRVTRAAVSVGTALGKAAARFDAWRKQRDVVVRELSAVIGRAQDMLSSVRAPGGKRKNRKAKSAARKTARTRGGRTARARKTAKKAR